jgi:hydrogenase maturation protease
VTSSLIPHPSSLRVLIAGVGYGNLRDLSVGAVLSDRLTEFVWPEGVEVEDWSYGPIAIVHRLKEAEPPFERVVIVAGVQRHRPPGTVDCYLWDGALPGDAEIQNRVAEAVTGVIDLDNLLIVTRYFGALPDDTVVVEVEPEDTDWGSGFSARVEALLDGLMDMVRHEALAPARAGVHGRAALGARTTNGH